MQASAGDGVAVGEPGDLDAVGEPVAGMVCAGVSVGACTEGGRSPAVSADEHDARVASVTTRARTIRPDRKIIDQPYVQTPRPEPVPPKSLSIRDV
jgi:hypothetical protein